MVDRPPRAAHVLRAHVVIMFVGYPVAFVLGGDRHRLRRPRHRVRRLPAGPVRQPAAAHLGPGGRRTRCWSRCRCSSSWARCWSAAASPNDLLNALQVLTRRIPGGLAMSVTLMGTIMAATTGIVGASVIMLTLIALPTMLAAGYYKELAVGTIASAGTLGILIPPSIMLVIMGDLLDGVGRHAVHRGDHPGPDAVRAVPRLHRRRCALPEAAARAAAAGGRRARRRAREFWRMIAARASCRRRC